LVAGGGEDHIGVAAFLVRTAAELAQAEHLEEGDGVLQRTDADHGVQIFSHEECPSVSVLVAARRKGRQRQPPASTQAPSSNSSRLAMGRLMRSLCVVPLWRRHPNR